MKIGLIGLGIVGGSMVRNLLRAGHELIAYDVVRSNMDEVVRGGTRAASSSRNVATRYSLIIAVLPNSPHAKNTVLGADGVSEGAASGTILVDMSFVAPLASQEICRECEKKGAKVIDAPMSGDEPKAIDGTPSTMASGEKEALEQVYDVLMTMGTSTVHYGGIGAENTAKLANQVIVALNIATVSETSILSTRAGVDLLEVFGAVKSSLAGSTIVNAKAPMIAERNFTPGLKIDPHIEDLGDTLEIDHGVGAPLPFTAQVMEIMQNLYADGLGENDHSAVARYYEKLTGTEIRK